MKIPTNVNRLLLNRTAQAMFSFREFRLYADQLITEINQNRLTGAFLSEKLNAAVPAFKKLKATINGPENADVRTSLASEFNMTDVGTDLSAAKIEIKKMMKSMSDLIALIKASGQIVDADDVNGRKDSVVTTPETDALLASAIHLRDNIIEDPNL